MYKAIAFDLDGTLLNTLPDIVAAVNIAMTKCGYHKTFTFDDGKVLIGNGADVLCQRAVEGINDKNAFDKFKKAYLVEYKLHQEDTTKPFDGMIDVISALKKEGLMLFVVTNKPQNLANVIVNKFFTNLFDGIYGLSDGTKEKPDTYLLNKLMKEFQLKPQEILFVGDSIVDVDTARNAKLDLCLVTYGYGDYNNILKDKSIKYCNSVKELKSFVLLKK